MGLGLGGPSIQILSVRENWNWGNLSSQILDGSGKFGLGGSEQPSSGLGGHWDMGV